jgi:hypothetical protein
MQDNFEDYYEELLGSDEEEFEEEGELEELKEGEEDNQTDLKFKNG